MSSKDIFQLSLAWDPLVQSSQTHWSLIKTSEANQNDALLHIWIYNELKHIIHFFFSYKDIWKLGR